MSIQKIENFPSIEPTVDGALQTNFPEFDPYSYRCSNCNFCDLCGKAKGTVPCVNNTSLLDITGTQFSALTTEPIKILPRFRYLFDF